MRMRRTSYQRGQASIETVLMLPLILAVTFALLQIGLIGLAFIYANYGANSMARIVVRSSSSSITNPNVSTAELDRLLVAGLKAKAVTPRKSGSYPRQSVYV